MTPMPIPTIPPSYTLAQKLVSIENVGLTLDGKVILRNVNAEIRDIERADCAQGQCVAFLGPSGIGKTRLSRIIAGLDLPTAGGVQINTSSDSLNPKMIPVQKGVVGMVPQSSTLFDFQTVRENLRTSAVYSSHPSTAWATKAPYYIAQFGLQDHLDKYPIQLSGGTRQRVAIVRQLLCSEHFIVMDEPFSGLDPIMKGKASETITALAGMDTLNTIILVSHDISEALACSDTVWLMGYEQVDGQWQPGAKIVETIDLASRGLCWRPDIQSDPQFLEVVAYVKGRFRSLRP